MIIKLIFTCKEECNSIEIDEVKQMLKAIFEINGDSIILEDSSTISSVWSKARNSKYVLLKLEAAGNNSKHAENLSDIRDRIKQGEHRKNFHITVSYDESSDYYCEKLFKQLSKYERKLRYFVYVTLIELFGNEWIDKTLNEEIEGDIKKRSNSNKLIENALEEFEYHHYKQFLFQEHPDYDCDIVIEEALDYLSKGDINENELVEILERGNSRSLWERFFEGSGLIDLQDNINEIQTTRNIVMHNKEMNNKVFKESKSLLIKSRKELEKAIYNIENGNHEDVSIVEILSSLKYTLRGITEIAAKSSKELYSAVENIRIPAIEIMNSTGIVTELSNSLRNSIPQLDDSLFHTMKAYWGNIWEYNQNISLLREYSNMAVPLTQINRTKEILQPVIETQLKFNEIIRPAMEMYLNHSASQKRLLPTQQNLKDYYNTFRIPQIRKIDIMNKENEDSHNE